jgi:uncharacterized protein with PQ loop repeat
MPIFGTLAVVASLAIMLGGFPAQIIKNYRRKSCEGLAPLLIYSSVCSTTLWSLYGWTKPDLFIALAQTPGSIMAFILLFQLLWYRKKGKGNDC